MYFIIVRDPFAWIHSLRNESFSLHCGKKIESRCILNDSNWPTLEFENSAQVWKTYINGYTNLKKTHPENIRIIRYEDLVTSGVKLIHLAFDGTTIQVSKLCVMLLLSARPWVNKPQGLHVAQQKLIDKVHLKQLLPEEIKFIQTELIGTNQTHYNTNIM